jgi:hypothetical protein
VDESAGPDPTPEIDERLWVELTDSDGRWYISGNPHTFPGRFDVWSPVIESALTVSKSDIAKASDAAWWWIAGFLSGNEPSLDDYVGADAYEAGIDDEHPAFRRWRAAIDHFRRTGDTMILERRPVRPMPVATVNGHVPWVWVGGELWEWTGTDWRVAADQPSLSEFPGLTPIVLPGTVCVDQNHEMEVVGNAYVSCVNCGWTSEGVVE